MNLTDFSKGSVWGIRPAHLEEMLSRMPDLKQAAKEAVKFTENPEQRDDFLLREGVAIVPIAGTITKRRSFWSFFYGGAPLNALTTILVEALDDPDVEAILLDIDSPGGTVAGTEAFSNLVYEARRKKPVVAFANGMMASAAYWIGSAANRIVVEPTADVGSIGVVMVQQGMVKGWVRP